MMFRNSIIAFFLLTSSLLYAGPYVKVIPPDCKNIHNFNDSSANIYVDIGRFELKQKKNISLVIKNTGDSNLKILQVRKTCTCTEYELSKRVIPPEDSAVLKIVLLPYSLSGKFTKTLYIKTNDPKKKIFGISLTGHAIPAFIIRPGCKIFAGRFQKNEEKNIFFDLIPVKKGSKLGKPTYTSNYPISVSMQNIKSIRNEYIKLKASFYIDNIKGDLSATIKVPILKPAGWEPINIKITGKVGPSLYINPKRIVFSETPKQDIERRIRLTIVGKKRDKDFVVRPEELSVEKISGIKLLPYSSKGNSIYITLSISPDIIKRLRIKSPLRVFFNYQGIKNSLLLFYTPPHK